MFISPRSREVHYESMSRGRSDVKPDALRAVMYRSTDAVAIGCTVAPATDRILIEPESN